MRFQEKTEGLLNFSDLKKVRFCFLYWGMFLFLLLVSMACIVPIIWVFLSGFKDTSELYRIPPTIIPQTFDIRRAADAWNKIELGANYLNTFYIIVGAWFCDILFNGLAGYVLSRLKPLGSKILNTLIFWSMLLPGISLVPLYMTFVDMPLFHINLTGSFVPIWIMAGANAFNVLLFRNFFNSIPISYLEAARLDGCSDFSIFFKIILPLSKPIIMVVTIFSVTGSWSNFMWPYLILGSSDLAPISVKLYELSNGSIPIQDNEMMLIMMLSIIPPAIMYAFFSKHIMGGVSMSGLKG